MIKQILLITILAIAFHTGINADTPDIKNDKQFQTWVDSASTAYMNKNYHKAVEYYQQIINHGMVSANLHYNTGNSLYKQGYITKAILHYEKALKLNPAHEDASVNLQIANNMITDRIEPASIPFYKRWYKQLWQLMPVSDWAIVSISAFIILILSVLIFVFTSSLSMKKTIFPIGVIALIITILSLVLGSEARSYMENTHRAIVFEPTLNVKSSPDESGTNLFTIHEGLKVKIREELNNWSRIEITDGRVGWVPSGAYKEI